MKSNEQIAAEAQADVAKAKEKAAAVQREVEEAKGRRGKEFDAKHSVASHQTDQK